MNKYQLKLKCSCGFEEVLTEMEENGLQIHIGSSDATEEHSKLVLDCKNCGTKISLELTERRTLIGVVGQKFIDEGAEYIGQGEDEYGAYTAFKLPKKEEDVPEEIRNEG